MIAITAGHHKKDPGAVSARWGNEADANRLFRDTLAYYLRKANVPFWKDEDSWSLSLVIKKVKALKLKQTKTLAIDIHFNASSNPGVRGTEVIVDDKTLKSSPEWVFAERLTKATAEILDTKDRGVKQERDTYRKRLAYLDICENAFVYEIGFISNDYDMIAFNAYYWLLAKKVSELIAKYYHQL